MNLVFLICLLLICFLLMPIGLYFAVRSLFNNRNGRKSLLAVKDGFKRLVERHTLSISDAEVYGSRLIAIDRKMNKLVLVLHTNGVTWEKCFALDDLIFCRIVKATSTECKSTGSLCMELQFRNEPVIVSFIFFDEQTDDIRDLPSRTRKFEYWKRKLQYQMSISQISNTLQNVI